MRGMTLRTMRSIETQVDMHYQYLRSKCETYEELEREIKGIQYGPSTRYGSTTRDYLVNELKAKMEEEKNRLPIQ